MKKNKYMRRMQEDLRLSVCCFIFIFIISFAVYIKDAKEKGAADWGMIVRTLFTCLLINPFTYAIIIDVLVNFIYNVLYHIAASKGVKYKSSYTLESKRRLDRKLGENNKFIVHLPDGEIRKSINYEVRLEGPNSMDPKGMCTFYLYMDMIFICEVL